MLFLEGLVDNLTEVYIQSVLIASNERDCQRTKYYVMTSPFGWGRGGCPFYEYWNQNKNQYSERAQNASPYHVTTSNSDGVKPCLIYHHVNKNNQ